MNLGIKTFITSYDDYEKLVNAIPKESIVLEVGAGAFPSLNKNKIKEYYLLDPDSAELGKNESDKVINCSIEEYETSLKFDFIISKMVLEHVSDPISFHRKILKLLSPGGKVYHFFACGQSIPSLINSWIPEKVSELILRVSRSRDIDNEPKYVAYYKWTNIFSSTVLENYKSIGYNIKMANVYIGHNYLHAVPILNYLEKAFSRFTYLIKFKRSASVGLLVLSNK